MRRRLELEEAQKALGAQPAPSPDRVRQWLRVAIGNWYAAVLIYVLAKAWFG